MVNGIWYTIEGDGVNATISFASTIPLVYLTSAKYIGKIVKLADGSYSVVKFGGKSTKEFLENIQRIDLDADGLKQLNKDLADKEFAEAIVENPKLVDSWKVLDGAGVDDVVRRNIDELELVSKNIDEIKAFDGGYKAWKINNAGGDVLTKLLKNSDYKKVYDDLVSGVTPRKFADELTLQEEAIYKFYTNESYYKFNDALIQNSNADDILELEKLLNTTLDKVPSSPGTYFRGIGKAELDKIKRLRIGDDITYENFVSTTSEDFYAWRFLRNNKVKTGEGAFVEVVSKNGKSIDKFSDATEFEILHKSKSKFELKSIEYIEKEILNIDDVALSGATPDIVEDFYKIVLIEK